MLANSCRYVNHDKDLDSIALLSNLHEVAISN